MLRRTSDLAPPSEPEAPCAAPRSRIAGLRAWTALLCQRALFSWHAHRFGRGRSVTLRAEAGLVRVDDGMRHIHAPNVARAGIFRDGINLRLEAVAEKYFGTTGYVPRPGDAVVDIGAGIGEFTLWCHNAGARIVAFEPDPLAFACLGRNTAGMNVQLYPYALWKERANLRLHGSPDTSESSLIEDGNANVRHEDVEAWSLDGLKFLTRLPVIDLMKIDGEGVEPEIIAGGRYILQRTRIIVVDVGAVGRRPKLRERTEEALVQMGFRTVPTGREDSLLALNIAMVGPFNNRVLGRHG
jgi:FkbM family methyltransferase